MEEACVVIPEDGAGIPEIQKFQNYLDPEFKIVLYDFAANGRTVFF